MHDSLHRCISAQSANLRVSASKWVFGSHSRAKVERGERPGQGEGEDGLLCRLATLRACQLTHRRFSPAVLTSSSPHHPHKLVHRPFAEMQPTSHTNASSTTVGTTSSSTPLVGNSDSKKVTTLLHTARNSLFCCRNPRPSLRIRANFPRPPVQSSSSKLFKSLFSSNTNNIPSTHTAEERNAIPKESAVEKLARLRKQAGDPSVQVSRWVVKLGDRLVDFQSRI